MSDLPAPQAPWLRKSSDKKRAATVKKITDAVKEMELDIQRNDNIYPFNGGAVNQSEVCRRAGIKNTILQGPAHIDTTKVMVDAWVADVNKGLITGRKNVRKAVTARVEDWKEEHAKLATSYRIDMHRLDLANERIKELTEENAALREQLAKVGSNVTALKPKRKKGDDAQQ